MTVAPCELRPQLGLQLRQARLVGPARRRVARQRSRCAEWGGRGDRAGRRRADAGRPWPGRDRPSGPPGRPATASTLGAARSAVDAGWPATPRDHSPGGPTARPAASGTRATSIGRRRDLRTRRMPVDGLRPRHGARGRVTDPRARPRRRRCAPEHRATRTSSGASCTSTPPSPPGRLRRHGERSRTVDAMSRADPRHASRRTPRPHQPVGCTYGNHTVRSSPSSSTRRDERSGRSASGADTRDADHRHAARSRASAPSPRGTRSSMITARMRRCTRAMRGTSR